MANDAYVDLSEVDKKPTHHAINVKWWAAAGVLPAELGDTSRRPAPYIGWAVPRWPAFIDAEVGTRDWHDQVFQRLEGGSADEIATAEDWIDSIAYWLLRSICNLMEYRKTPSGTRFELGPDSEQWHRLAQRIREIAHNAEDCVPAPRSGAFLNWVEALGTYCTPESGLRREARGAFRAGLAEAFRGSPLVAGGRRLMELRVDRLKFQDDASQWLDAREQLLALDDKYGEGDFG